MSYEKKKKKPKEGNLKSSHFSFVSNINFRWPSVS